MKLTHIMAARLTLDNGESVMVERLGKGMFHTCYVDRATNTVYSVTIEREAGEDYSKEILSHPALGCGGTDNPHIPKVEHLGTLEGRDNRVYKMPLYRSIKASNRVAWSQLKALEKAKVGAWRHVYNQHCGFGHRDIGYMVNAMVCDTLVDQIPETLRDALQELRDAASNYGSSYCFEFSRRNVMVDGAGNLILLDVLFNLETVEKMRAEKVKKARGYL